MKIRLSHFFALVGLFLACNLKAQVRDTLKPQAVLEMIIQEENKRNLIPRSPSEKLVVFQEPKKVHKKVDINAKPLVCRKRYYSKRRLSH